MGQRVGEELAQCFASADVFAFPSFTEVGHGSYRAEDEAHAQTFGQVVLEALASGLVSLRIVCAIPALNPSP